MIKKEEVEKIALLAKIELTEKEAEKISNDLESILQYAKKLEDVDTKEVEPLFHFSELKNIVREDEVEEKERIIGEEKKGKDGYFRVESIL